MRNQNLMILVSSALLLLTACVKENKPNAVPIAPLLKEIVMPKESNTIPGTTVTISGKGFDRSDIISCKSVAEEKEADFIAEIVNVTDYGVSITIPSNAAGPYEVSIERHGLTTILTETLNVAYILVIEDLLVPSATVSGGAILNIQGKGFAEGDKVIFSSEAYPASAKYEATVTLTTDGISVAVPEGCYGVNNMIIARGKRQNQLGQVPVAVAVGDAIGGGIVYYVSDSGIHGLIAKKTNTATATQKWGPSERHGGTRPDIYSGKQNTALLVAKMVDFHAKFATWPDTNKSAAELCYAETETVDGIVYDDWFLPSQLELCEMFKVKDMLNEKGATVPANNYWSSTEGIGDANADIWAAMYVNFYEPVNLVTALADKEAWLIGIRAIRQF